MELPLCLIQKKSTIWYLQAARCLYIHLPLLYKYIFRIKYLQYSKKYVKTCQGQQDLQPCAFFINEFDISSRFVKSLTDWFIELLILTSSSWSNFSEVPTYDYNGG